MPIDVVIILVLILANGVFSLAETAVVASRKARLEQRADEGDGGARAALALANDPTRFLSTTQLGITLIGVISGAFGGAALSGGLAALLGRVPALAPYADALGFALVVLAITYLSLVLGELVPKRLALNNAEGVAARVAGPMGLLSRVAAPAVTLLVVSTTLVLRLLRARPSQGPPVTEEEVRILLEQGAEAGVFTEAEEDMVGSVFRLADRRVNDLMTPRPHIVWLDAEASPEENARRMAASPHSSFPVCRGDLDHVVGITSVKEVWARTARGLAPHLTEGTLPPVYVPESVPALRALEALRGEGTHVAIVLDEYGGTAGIITLIDMLEAIVGDLPPRGQPAGDGIRRRDDGSWLIDGLTPVGAATEALGVDLDTEAERDGYQTVGGFVLAHLGRIPSPGDAFAWRGLRVEVIDMDGPRVDKALVAPINADGAR